MLENSAAALMELITLSYKCHLTGLYMMYNAAVISVQMVKAVGLRQYGEGRPRNTLGQGVVDCPRWRPPLPAPPALCAFVQSASVASRVAGRFARARAAATARRC